MQMFSGMLTLLKQLRSGYNTADFKQQSIDKTQSINITRLNITAYSFHSDRISG